VARPALKRNVGFGAGVLASESCWADIADAGREIEDGAHATRRHTWDVQITEADRAISRDLELQIVAGREVHLAVASTGPRHS